MDPVSKRHSDLRRTSSVRRGALHRVVLLLLALIGSIGAAIWFVQHRTTAELREAPLLATVVRGPYEHVVLEQGEVESSNNVEVRCEVKNRSGSNNPSTTILDVIPEGTSVTKGDWLITFDSRTLENERTQQSIAAKTSETLVIEAKAAYDTAVISRKEYLEGTYLQERKTYENEIFVAEENLKKAELAYDSIKRSVARGLISPLQLEGEQFRVDAARKELELAQQKLYVLDNYTKEKMLTQFNSDIEATEIKWENEQASYEEELNKLKEIEEQIALCTVTAPQDGQVVYANVMSSRSSSEFVVEPGASVRERQEIILLPDPKNMQVKATINESRINLIKEGMQATIRIDALGDELFDGVVTKVNKYAEPGNWWSSTAKEYATEIKILNPPSQIRAGLTAEVRIHVEQSDDVLQVPVQAILEHQGQTFCLVKQDESYETHRVQISSSNDQVVALDEVSTDPLRADEEVVLNPRQYRDWFDFSDFPPTDAIAERPDPITTVVVQTEEADSADVALTPETSTAGDAISTEGDSVNAVRTTEKGG